MLLEQIVYWSRAPRIATSVDLVKPLFEEQGMRPDFILALPGDRRICVEVMTGLGAETRQEKLAAHAAMCALPGVADVVAFDAASDDAREFQRKLTGIVVREKGRDPSRSAARSP